MKKIAVIGAGKSSTVLIQYLLEHAETEDWTVTVADMDETLAASRVQNHPAGRAMAFDVSDEKALEAMVFGHDLIVSMLPAFMHLPVAKACVRNKKHLVTASYVSPEMQALHQEALDADIILMNEIGVDPGIDHMTAMEVLDELRNRGCKITGFESFTGGLMTEASEGNPWKYKITWNPRNIVLAGSGGAAKFMHHGRIKYIPYHKVFQRIDNWELPGWGAFEAYGNRDSLKYQKLYGLEEVRTMYRGTLRRPGFCRAWDVLVQLGIPDDSYQINCPKGMTRQEFLNMFLPEEPGQDVRTRLCRYLQLRLDSSEIEKLDYLGLFSNQLLPVTGMHSPAFVLQKILEEAWKLEPGDKDLLVMLHRFEFIENGEEKIWQSHLCIEGEDERYTAMARTVGLPAAIATRFILTGIIKCRGVQIPVIPEIYKPVLKELNALGISMQTYEAPELKQN